MTRKEKGEEIEKESEDIYSDEQREEQLEEDEISPAEAAFVEGYESPNMIQCKNCGKNSELEKMIEKKIDGETYWFCSKKCLERFDAKRRNMRKKL